MEAFLIGVVIGIAGAAAVFVLVNLEIPDGLDKMEAEMREGTEGYQAKKVRLGEWIKGKFKRN